MTVPSRAAREAAIERLGLAEEVEHIQKAKQAAIAGAIHRQQAPMSLESHAVLVHRNHDDEPLRPARHHVEWINILENRKKFPYVCLVAPPGYAKSTWVTVAYASWRLGVTGGRSRIIVASNTATQAWAFAQGVRETVSSRPFQAQYPGVGPDYERGWAKDQFWVTGSVDAVNPSMLAVGIEGPVVGKRADEIILDDPTTTQQAYSRVIMDGQRKWLKDTLIKRFPAGKQPPFGKGSRMVVVTTRWGENDLIPTLEDMGFQILVFPALGYWDRTVVCLECHQIRDPRLLWMVAPCEHCGSAEKPQIQWGDEPLWPEVESREQLHLEMERDPLTFRLQKMGDPSGTAGGMFDGATFQHGEIPREGDGDYLEQIHNAFDTIIQAVDTSSGAHKNRGDFFVIATVGIRKNGEEVWILDIERGRFQAPEQEAAVFREYEQWDPDYIIIEDANEGRALYQNLVAKGRLPLIKEAPTKSKEHRATPLANAYAGGRVWHPLRAKWRQTYESELIAFPNRGVYDDQVDSAALAYNRSVKRGPRVRTLVGR